MLLDLKTTFFKCRFKKKLNRVYRFAHVIDIIDNVIIVYFLKRMVSKHSDFFFFFESKVKAKMIGRHDLIMST